MCPRAGRTSPRRVRRIPCAFAMNASLLVYGCDQPSCPHLVIALRFDMLGRSCQIPMLDARNRWQAALFSPRRGDRQQCRNKCPVSGKHDALHYWLHNPDRYRCIGRHDRVRHRRPYGAACLNRQRFRKVDFSDLPPAETIAGHGGTGRRDENRCRTWEGRGGDSRMAWSRRL